MKASITAPIAFTHGSLTSDLELVHKNESYKKGFKENNTGYFLTSEGFLFLVWRFQTDDEMRIKKDELEKKYKEQILVVEISLKKDQLYAYLMSYYFSEESIETKYTNNINLNIDEFYPDKVFDLETREGAMNKEFFKNLLPQ